MYFQPNETHAGRYANQLMIGIKRLPRFSFEHDGTHRRVLRMADMQHDLFRFIAVRRTDLRAYDAPVHF